MNQENKILNIKFEKAIKLLTENLPLSNELSRKPILFHDIRVGVYLYNNGYSEDIVLAGILHDTIEWSNLAKERLQDEFGDNVVSLILANTKNDNIAEKKEKMEELINRCIQRGQDALIIKTADIIDSFSWYFNQNDKDGLEYCKRNANTILKYKPVEFKDKIFDELKIYTTEE